MARTIETTVYTFDELSEEAQQTAINNMCDINTDIDWYDNTYEDAKIIGLKLTGFDLDRNLHATGTFITDAIDCANLILENHGAEITGTWKLANNFLYDIRQNNTDSDTETLTLEGHDKQLDLMEEFLRALLVEYARMLQSDYEYLTSDEAIKETILSNECEFTSDGKLA